MGSIGGIVSNDKVKEIIIEIERVRVVQKRSPRYKAYCLECREETEFMTMTEAAAISETSIQKIFQCTEVGTLHTTVAPNGTVLVCLNSLLNTSFI
jgi:hypothetical protein